jgi:hypothetical protein
VDAAFEQEFVLAVVGEAAPRRGGVGAPLRGGTFLGISAIHDA